MGNRQPTPPQHIPQTHWATPIRTRLQYASQLIDEKSPETRRLLHLTKASLFAQNEVPRSTAYRIVKSLDPRRHHNSEKTDENRGRKRSLSKKDIRYLELLIRKGDWEIRVLTWEALAYEANLNVSGRTIQRAMHQLHFRRCLTCQKAWISPAKARKRVEWARDMLTRRPHASDWHNVRFSDETHMGYGSAGRTWVIRQPGEENCPDCVQHIKQPKSKDEKRIHVWAVVGYEYKSKLYPYSNGTSNGTMDLKTYVRLLEQECANWPPGFTLEEDGDSGHGTKGKNIAQAWKASHQLDYYANCPYSPDLAPIENAWLSPKAYLRKYGHWDDETIWEVANQGWDALTQKKINQWVESMPQRLQSVIDLKGQLTAY